MNAASPSSVDVALESKLAFLRQPSSFAEPTYRVEAVETHMSWVFLTDSHAYKLKKPVCNELLDFRSVEARHFYCEEEVRLNRRLAPRVYVGIVALVVNATGHLELGGNGQVTDWLVKMHRLEAPLMLDYRLRQQAACASDAARIAALLAGFHRACAPVCVAHCDHVRRLERDLGQDFTALGARHYHLPGDRLHRLHHAQLAALLQLSGALRGRVDAGKIVEGHGDLRPEHVYLGDDPAIIDCLEFSRDLRIADVIDEVAFLALECERLGAPAFGALLLGTYQHLAGDDASPALIHFYQSYRASSRARIAIRHLDEEKFRYSAEWRRRALEYLRLSEEHINAASGPAQTS